jgi:hypothetical protein
MYLDEIINKWQKEDVKENQLSKNHQVLKPLFADEKVTIPSARTHTHTHTKDNLQKAELKLNQTITEHALIISEEKIKTNFI